jgi:hypothetical protein
MSTKNKNTVKQAVLEAIQMKNTIKEESRNILKDMLGEAVKDAIRESIEDDDDSYEVVDDDAQAEDTVVEPESNEETPEEEPEVDSETEESEEDEWDDYSDFKAGDENTYDLTGVEDYDQIVKVYKLMKDDDQVVVKQDGDKIELTDNETGNEYVISLGTNADESIEGDGEEQDVTTENIVKEDTDIAGIPDDNTDFEFDESDLDLAEPANEELLNDDEPRFNESKKGKNVMKENKKVVYEVSLGYTDNYQDKDPIQGLSNNEPSKSGKSWEKGVPTGTEKPWAGSSEDKGEPFEKTVNEEEQIEECGAAPMTEEPVVDEATNVGGAVQQRSNSKSHIPNNRKEYGPKVKRHVSTAEDGYDEMVESLKKENEELKKLNEAYKKQIIGLKKGTKELKENVKESYIVNANLAKITRLFTENVVSQDEKREIVNRFANEAKTIEQSKALYESIDKELKKNQKQITLENNVPTNVAGSKSVNENTYKSQELLNTLDLIKRIEQR